ncbi:MAG: rhodanese-like domain-containing protein [Fimbriiglobus sp.]|jgi:adenylyltransferase/sulfurtransferase|nr:rhodanese-like domain-containing protein [Fimbriiglobus sp.]
MITQIHPRDVKAKLDTGEPVVLIDCREPEEYAICRIEGSTLLPLGELARRADEVEVPEGAMVVVYCHHGVRSINGAFMLARAGIPNVASMAGGIEAWSVLIDPSVPRY